MHNCLTTKDFEAFNRMRQNGEVIYLQPGTEVYVVEQDWGVFKIRPKGETTELYCLIEAIQ